MVAAKKEQRRDPTTAEHLQDILRIIAEQRIRGGSSLVVLDLDSTLFDTAYRSAAIFRHWAEQPENQQHYPELCAVMRFWQKPREIYDPVSFVKQHCSVVVWPEEVEGELRSYWRERFFQNSWLAYDQLYPGARDYVQKLHRAGARIHYLSARHHESMAEGTERSLIQHGMPLCSALNDSLSLKDSADLLDEDFKEQALGRIKQGYDEVIFIENEPLIVKMCLVQHPDILTYHYHSVDSGKIPADGCSPQVLKHW